MTIQQRVEEMLSTLTPMGTDSQIPGLRDVQLHIPTELERGFIDNVRALLDDVHTELEKR